MEMERNPSYEEAMARLEELVARIEQPRNDLSGVEADLKAAMELIRYCRAQLRGLETDFEKIMKEGEQA